MPLGNGEGNAILIGNGNGTFQVMSRIQIDETFAPLHVAVADYNRDGKLDIARTMGDGTNGLMQIMNGNGNGTFQAPVRYLVPPPGSSTGGIVIITSDWNADAKPDIAFVVGGASIAFDVLTNTTGGTGTDTVTITRAEYQTGNRRLRVEATSTNATATLQVFVTSTNQLIGTLANAGGGRFRGQFSWPVNPQTITVRSNFGGQTTRNVTVR